MKKKTYEAFLTTRIRLVMEATSEAEAVSLMRDRCIMDTTGTHSHEFTARELTKPTPEDMARCLPSA